MPNFKPCLYAFDMNSFFAREYSTLTKDGEPQGRSAFFEGEPVFAMAGTLRLMQKEFHYMHTEMGNIYTHIALVFDHPGKNFRHALDPNYKANRPPKPESWRRQEMMLCEFFQQLGFPCLQIEGVEADDVIGTLANSLALKDIFTMIFSGDKDMMSLCNYHIALRAGRERKTYDNDAVAEKFGVPCERVLDYLTIVGDAVDGVKGIPNLGDAAAKTILNHMTLPDLLDNPQQLITLNIRGGKKVAEWIQAHRHEVAILRQLIQLKLDVPLNTNLKSLRMSPPDIRDNLIGRFIKQRNIQHAIPDSVWPQ